ncbi:NADH pyrophosphatase [Bifidobacterium dolichotidis]|uniref:NAD(+) diphosphatase n=1 Tax=Bifidobacterium dolichotidis TaxID=2306976 RepID=A0A430FRQ2_9BIFI|nr:NAD(+) diphosphatase [Bifidobacterium dolichotidis]RSX55540.1 NADH pyrophosphatase [Bifidobacterium dolichotidis]
MFSPLAFTQTLPFLPLAQGDISYEIERRNEPGLIAQLLQEPHTHVILVRNGLLAVPRDAQRSPHTRLATLPGSYVSAAVQALPIAAMYLGAYGKGEQAERVIALNLTGLEGLAQELKESQEAQYSVEAVTMLLRACAQLTWMDLRSFVPHASSREIGQATTALSLANWHDRQHYCPACGAPTVPAHAGWAQRCTNADDGRELFPRVEPAVITAIVDQDDRLLVQHNAAWSNPLLYSVSAGFVEAGENLEHAARREAFEETGIEIGEVKYLGSQPWPFPGSLMMAFKAVAKTTDIHVDNVETVAAEWVTREEYMRALVTGRMEPPVKAAIARVMIEQWLGHTVE